jgi:hypothetical protein
LPYTIDFENDGTAAAQDITVTEQLDPNIDWSTFLLGSFGFGPINVTIPAGLTQYQTTVSYQNSDGSSLNVQVSLDFNVQTGLLTVTFVSLDPLTNQTPTGVFDGFLYPESDSPLGSDGYVQYTVQPRTGLTTGTTINQQAAVVFDTNAPLNTAVVTNTIDAGPPTSSVAALPPYSPGTFTVSWSGSDDAGGSGIAFFDVYVSDNGGSYTLWQDQTTQTSAAYSGQVGHTYRFFSVATDNVGNVQPTPAAAQATTQIAASPVANSQSVVVSENTAQSITLTGSAPNNDPLAFTITTNPAHGSLSNTTPTLTFTPNTNFTGSDSFRFTVTDMTTGFVSTAATVSIAVQPQQQASVSSVWASWGSQTVALQTATDGVRLLPAGRTTDLPWPNLQTFTITLSQAAPLNPANVSVTGLIVANYGLVSLSGSGTNYTITLSQPISAADRVTLTIGNASITPFTRRLDVLPGDGQRRRRGQHHRRRPAPAQLHAVPPLPGDLRPERRRQRGPHRLQPLPPIPRHHLAAAAPAGRGGRRPRGRCPP